MRLPSETFNKIWLEWQKEQDLPSYLIFEKFSMVNPGGTYADQFKWFLHNNGLQLVILTQHGYNRLGNPDSKKDMIWYELEVNPDDARVSAVLLRYT